MKSIAKVYAVFKRIINTANFFLAIISAVAVITVMLTTMTSSFCRWMLVAIHGINELNSLLVGMAIYLGIALAQTNERHLSVRFLVLRLSPRNRRILNIALLAIAVALFSRVSYVYYHEAYRALITLDILEGIIMFPLWPLAYVMFVGITMLTIELVIGIIESAIPTTATRSKAVSSEVQSDTEEQF